MPATPAQRMERALNHRVTLVLKDSRRLSGVLLGVDEHLNIVLDETEESTEKLHRRIGRVVLRGSNIVSLFAPDAAPGGSG